MTAALAASARSRRAPLRSVPRETTMQLITDEQRERLLANGRRTAAGENIDPPPVVKLFTPDANATWLLTELDPAEPDRAFGLYDLGLGFPEPGYVSLAELRRLRGPLGMPAAHALGFAAAHPISSYASRARTERAIPTPPPCPARWPASLPPSPAVSPRRPCRPTVHPPPPAGPTSGV